MFARIALASGTALLLVLTSAACSDAAAHLDARAHQPGSSSPTRSGLLHDLRFCRQTLLAHEDSAAWGRQQLSGTTKPAARTPTTSSLPRTLEPGQRVSSYGNVVVISTDCARGATVVVHAPRGIATVGTAHALKGRGYTAILLARLSQAPHPLTVTITAYRNRHYVGTLRQQI